MDTTHVRTAWEGLPSALRDAVHDRLGSMERVEPMPEGRRSAFAALATIRGGERVFLKGAPAGDAKAVGQLDREAAISPHVALVSPGLLADLEVDGWRLLVFEYVPGRRANYSPDSPDLPAVVETLAVLDTVACPGGGPPLKWFEARWSSYAADPRRLSLLAGPAVLHTDLNPGNMVVTGRAARLVDWGMASLGARFVNPADLVVNLIACGHEPCDAEAVVADLDAWRDADTGVVDYYARLLAATWLEAFWTYRHPWARTTVRAAQRWALFRRDRL